jgi:hypothetical protein
LLLFGLQVYISETIVFATDEDSSYCDGDHDKGVRDYIGIVIYLFFNDRSSSTFTCVNVNCRNKDTMAVQKRWNGIKIVKRSQDQALLYYEYRYILKN